MSRLGLEQGLSTCERKILHEVKGTGAYHCSENNRMLVTVDWSVDFALLSTQSGDEPAAAPLTYSLHVKQ